LRTLLRERVSEAQLADQLLHAIRQKPQEHQFRDAYVPGRPMAAIGG
jgi:hypothetical protein